MDRWWALALFGWLAAGAAGDPQSRAAQPSSIDLRSIGPQVGATVPSFLLPDQTSAARSLESTMGRAGLVLVFFRSADW